MLLAIDAGNSNVVIGCFEGEKIVKVFRMVTDSLKTEDEYAAGIKSILEFNNFDMNALSGAVISCVVPPLTKVFRGTARQLTGEEAFVIGSGIKTGLNILIDNPAELAADMVSSAVGALSSYPVPAITIDMGTATKICAIDANKSFLGGAICPGIEISSDALFRGAALLPRVPVEAPKKAISSNTRECMQSGIVYGAAAMIEGMIARFEEELGTSATVIATGGLAPQIIPHCRVDIIHDPILILNGLRVLYERNR
ncbi:MAG: type III pantothenate kinase [Clostridiales bacterium]|nr:type III pantothenate kinase [Clostridiales bacterium]